MPSFLPGGQPKQSNKCRKQVTANKKTPTIIIACGRKLRYYIKYIYYDTVFASKQAQEGRGIRSTGTH